MEGAAMNTWRLTNPQGHVVSASICEVAPDRFYLSVDSRYGGVGNNSQHSTLAGARASFGLKHQKGGKWKQNEKAK
jgi:hypothetical protein